MKKLLYSILIICLIVPSLIGFAYLYAKSKDFFFVQISELVQQGTGYTLDKTGPLEGDLFPRPSLIARKLSVSNPVSFSHETQKILYAERLIVSLRWESLFQSVRMIDLELESADLDLQLDKTEQPNWSTPELQEEGDDLPISIGKIQARNTQTQFLNLATRDELSLELEQFTVDLEKGRSDMLLNSTGRIGDVNFLAEGEIAYQSDTNQLKVDLSVGMSNSPVRHTEGSGNSSHDDLIAWEAGEISTTGTVRGALSFRDDLPYGELDFKARTLVLGNLNHLAEELKYLNAAAGPISATGVLQLNGSDLDINRLMIRHQSEELAVEVDGEVHDLLSEVRSELAINGRVMQFSQLIAPDLLESNSLDELRNISYTATITQDNNEIKINDLNITLSHRSLTTSLKGNMGLEQDTLSLHLNIEGEADKPGDLSELFDLQDNRLTETIPFKFGAEIEGSDKHLSINRSFFRTRDGLVKASLSGNLIPGDKLLFDLQPSLEVDDFSLISSQFPEQYQSYLPGTRASASARLNGHIEAFSINQLQASIFHQETALQLEGDIQQLPHQPNLDVDVRFSTRQAIDLQEYFPELKDMLLAGPLTLEANVTWNDRRLGVEKIRLLEEQNDLSGEFSVDLTQQPPRIFASFDSRQFSTRLIDNRPEPPAPAVQAQEEQNEVTTNEEAEDKPSSAELSDRFKAYTSNILIDTDWIDQLSLDFRFSADRAQIDHWDTEDLFLAIRAVNGVFELSEYRLTLDEKPLSIAGSINTLNKPPTYALAGNLGGWELEELLNVEDSLLEGGELKGEFELSSKGSTLGKLIENLNGNALFQLGQLSIKSTLLDTVSSSILSTMLGGVIRKQEDAPASAYECGILGVDIENGVASISKSLALQAEDYNLAGNGIIDLNAWTLNLQVIPKPKKGLGLSLSTLVGGFKVEGHMATPDFGVGGGLVSAMILGYAFTPVMATAAMTNPFTASIAATGYLLTGLVDRMTAANYNCDATLKRIQRDRLRKEHPENLRSNQIQIF